MSDDFYDLVHSQVEQDEDWAKMASLSSGILPREPDIIEGEDPAVELDDNTPALGIMVFSPDRIVVSKQPAFDLREAPELLRRLADSIEQDLDD